MFTLDRVQISQNNTLSLFEFIMVNDIEYIKNFFGGYCDGSKLEEKIGKINEEKLKFLLTMDKPVNKYIIFYEEGIRYEEASYVVYFFEIQSNEWKWWPTDFKQLSLWFREANGNRNMRSLSKPLGVARTDDYDDFVCDILAKVHGLEKYVDDCGIGLTKKMLDGDSTTGVDFDLFYYISSTNEFIIMEFLKRENKYITNEQAHPMRYAWNGKKDNRKKFITLWKAKQILGGKLYLVNYSDDLEENVSIIEVVDLDETFGIRVEKKYCMSYRIFIAWLNDMKTYRLTHNDYLRQFRVKEYNEQYFDNWEINKSTYGKDFYNK